ncbi:hypothetical protein M2146_002726 [Lachnospiraceae bacterium PF1-22]
MINRKRKALLTTMSIILLILVVGAGILGIKIQSLWENTAGD